MDPQALQLLCQDSQQIPLLVFAWTLVGAAILVTSFRLYSKSRRCSGITVDDCVALASSIFATTAVSFLTVWIHLGLGRHIQCVTDAQLTLLWSLLAQSLNNIGLCLIKVSVCLNVLRLLDRELRLIRFLIWILIAFVSLSHLVQVVLFFLQCKPLDALWDTDLQHARCWTQTQLSLVFYIGNALDAVTDLICASIPMAVIRRLVLSDREKAGLCVLIIFGFLVAACAVGKTATVSGIWAMDFTWETVTPAWFTIAELYGAIVLASIPNLMHLFAPNAKSRPYAYDVETERNGSLYSVPRKGSTWTITTPRIPIPGMTKKHLSTSTFGMSDLEEGSRLTLVDNRLTVVGGDDDRLTCVAEEDEIEGRSARTNTLKGSFGKWNQEDVLGLGILGKTDTFGREGSISSTRLRADTSVSSRYSVGKPNITRPGTPKSLKVQTRPTTPRVGSRPSSRPASRPSSRPGTPKSPGFAQMPGTPRTPRSPGPFPRMPSTRSRRRVSTASSIYSEQPMSAGMATIPSPPTAGMPTIIEPISRQTTPKTPNWIASPSGFTTPKGTGSRTPTGARTPTGSSTPKMANTPKAGTPRGSRPGTPKRSMSIAVPVSKFRAEISEEVVAEVKKVGKFSDLGMEKGKALPRPPLGARVVDIPNLDRFDPSDTSY